MSEELSIMYNFFKMFGAKMESFVLSLRFCDILNDETILDDFGRNKKNVKIWK